MNQRIAYKTELLLINLFKCMSLLHFDFLSDIHHLGKHSNSSSNPVVTMTCPIHEIQLFYHVKFLFYIVEILSTLYFKKGKVAKMKASYGACTAGK